MTQYRITNTALSDIADILKHTQVQFGTGARVRYQELIRTAIEDLALVPTRIGSSMRDEVAFGLRSFHLVHSRKRAATANGMVQSPRHIVFYRLAEDQVIEIVRILHDAMEARLHLPQD
ncbi:MULTISPECIES: type II toxin-antitoxin system RelE/ParE family toxin [Pseudomonas]|uniref:type II toxin-antitoxin system RelE/ParE family toxin n=1 Tax=Pseudomonas TaxID=286 RepID=UPI000F57C11D|nr:MULTISPECIES: type II toxin-antitoxin system RelE/ParE family toxin [Pseudomonas]AZC84044.1 Plasmid stabilization system [Pseudomonas chlororaphis subsp. piscium]WJV24425.1 type II toxin-antitoxin system RelE/ParE family toxin [Pseudomonas chlororaphis]